MHESITIYKLPKKQLFFRFVVIYLIIFLGVVTTKFFLELPDKEYIEYVMTFKHYGFTNIIVDVMFLYYLFVNKKVSCNEEKVCLQSSSLFSNSDTCISYPDIKVVTQNFGIFSIRTHEKIITLDSFTYSSEDIKKVLNCIEEKSTCEINPKMTRQELIGIVFFLTILVGFYAWIFIFMM